MRPSKPDWIERLLIAGSVVTTLALIVVGSLQIFG